MEIPGWRPGSKARQQPRKRLQLCTRGAASARQKSFVCSRPKPTNALVQGHPPREEGNPSQLFHSWRASVSTKGINLRTPFDKIAARTSKRPMAAIPFLVQNVQLAKTARDQQRFAGNPFRIVRREEDRCRGNVV